MNKIVLVERKFESLNDYVYKNEEKITKEDFKNMFKQDVNVINMMIDGDDLDWYDTEKIVTPLIYIVCELENKRRGFEVPCEWFLDRGYGWKDYIGANINFFTGEGDGDKWFNYTDTLIYKN